MEKLILTAVVSAVLGALGGAAIVSYTPSVPPPYGLKAEERAFLGGMTTARIFAMRGSLGTDKAEIQTIIFKAGLTKKDLLIKEDELWSMGIVTVDMLNKKR